MTEVDFGWLIRSVHTWSANLLIGVLFLHLLTTYIMRAYRPHRELTWITGVLLFFVFLAFGFSGYLLPWNQLAFFATSVGTEIVGVIPVVGKYFLLLARGGENITGDTLARFYALHVVILPFCVLGLLAIHLYLVQKHEMSVPLKVIKKYGDEKNVPSMPFVPHFLLRDMVGWYVRSGFWRHWRHCFPGNSGKRPRPSDRRGHQTRVVLPVHVSNAQGSARPYRGNPVAGRGNGGSAVFWFLRAGGVASSFSGRRGEPQRQPASVEFSRSHGCDIFYRNDRAGAD